MKRKRYNEEQVIAILKENEAGVPVEEMMRLHGEAEPAEIARAVGFLLDSSQSSFITGQARNVDGVLARLVSG